MLLPADSVIVDEMLTWLAEEQRSAPELLEGLELGEVGQMAPREGGHQPLAPARSRRLGGPRGAGPRRVHRRHFGDAALVQRRLAC